MLILIKSKFHCLKLSFQYSGSFFRGGGRGGGRVVQVLPQVTECITLPAAQRRFFENSAEDRWLIICRSLRLMKNL